MNALDLHQHTRALRLGIELGFRQGRPVVYDGTEPVAIDAQAGKGKLARFLGVNLVSPRTAKEYGIETNGAGEDEAMQSMAISGGALDESEALSALDTGLAIGNLHYLNFSDRPSGRITGLTRFATFWVERGKIVAPVNVMRFDDTLYRLLGSHLEALTREPQWTMDTRTYGARSVQTSRVPGALVAKMAFTL